MIPLAFLAAFLGGAIAAVSGFGIGSLLTPVLLLWFAPPLAVAFVAIPHALSTAVRLWQLRTEIHRPTFIHFGVTSAAGGLLGALLQAQASSPGLTRVLAVLLAMAGLKELLGRPVLIPKSDFWSLAAGFLSGAFGGMVGNQGGIRSAALLRFDLSARQIVATATATAMLVDAARTPIYLWKNGTDMLARAGFIALLAAGVLAGTLAGVPLLSRIPPARYRQLLGGLLLALAFWLAAHTFV